MIKKCSELENQRCFLVDGGRVCNHRKLKDGLCAISNKIGGWLFMKDKVIKKDKTPGHIEVLSNVKSSS